ncbi:Carcinoembryonic antigen-related cell adhesion molecule 5 [Myotis brandtii]|uniref:Carcinoembryonic antigen-related cell adhesion molecule 5 n=1 Tax=Myotis brandtii TaxID=109478 RepID=S7MVE1_MYOBR|nr:Carcinoembryonic antigen-related cell adhesion molecule 5 [Myotis brandtii]
MEQAAVPMEFPAASAHRGRVHMLGLLLAVFLLTFWIPPTAAGFAIVSNGVVQGKDVILCLCNIPPDVIGFIWYKGIGMKYFDFIGSRAWNYSEYLTGPSYSHRVLISPEGPLIIRNATARDDGVYAVVAVLPKSRIVKGFGWLRVYRPKSVSKILASNTTVTENEDVVDLTCHTHEFHKLDFHCSKSADQGEDEAIP